MEKHISKGNWKEKDLCPEPEKEMEIKLQVVQFAGASRINVLVYGRRHQGSERQLPLVPSLDFVLLRQVSTSEWLIAILDFVSSGVYVCVAKSSQIYELVNERKLK